MSEYKNFNSPDELSNLELTRLDNFSYRGQRVSEIIKTEGQEAVIALSNRLITERLESLGLKARKIDSNRITYHIPVAMNVYKGEVDFVLLRDSSEADVGTTLHEFIHAASSEHHYAESKKIEVDKKQHKRNTRSGFHVNWYRGGFDKSSSVNFRNLNEAITEKIARELRTENHDEIRKMSSLFVGRCEQKIAEFEAQFAERREQGLRKIAEIQADAEREIAEVMAEHDAEVSMLDAELEKHGVPEERRADFRESKKESLDFKIGNIRMVEKYTVELERSTISDENKKKGVAGIKKGYSFTVDRDTYDSYIQVLDLLIEGASYAESYSLQEFERKRRKIWDDLQRAYFNGNSLYLRKFDKGYKEKIMRRFQNLSAFKDEEAQQMKQYLVERNQTLKSF